MKNSDGGAAWVGQGQRGDIQRAKWPPGAGLVSTAVGTGGPESQPKHVFELHGGDNRMRAAMQIADAIEPFDYHGKEQEEPVHQHAVGVVMLNVFHAV